MEFLSYSKVAISAGHKSYSGPSPYSPGEACPEYPFDKATLSGSANPAYEGVRHALKLLGLDSDRFDQESWSPLGTLVRPGDTVVLKPNFVRDFRETHPGLDDCVITHGSIIRAVADYVFIAMQGKGRIVIADAPQNDADFEVIRKLSGLDELQAFYRSQAGFDLEVYDLRPERAEKVDGVIVGHKLLPGDPAGYVKVNLAMQSAFAEINHLCHLLYGSEYDMDEVHRHQHDDLHEYLISKTVLEADVVISLPKLKTHKKVGLTVNMKNLVGINGNKNWLPHHREGTPSQGGDQFAEDTLKRRIEQTTVARFKRWFPMLGWLRPVVAGPIKALGRRVFGDTNIDTIRSGNWYGNDTAWRMCLDLNRILMYADSSGRVHGQPIRRFFSVVDGIVAGEGNGPLDPIPKSAGAVLAGGNPVAVDLASARLMDFDYQQLPLLCRALLEHELPLVSFGYEEVEACSNQKEFEGPITKIRSPGLAFEPHFGWKGHVEIEAKKDAETPVA